jgi:UDP-N-acetylmuramoyl-tripeptide--D-alanyl-D-alanine ligase
MRSSTSLVRRAGVTLVDDTYNANPTSVCASLEAFASMAPPAGRIAVLGDMRELGPGSPAHHRAVGRWVARIGVGTLVTVGPLAREIGLGASEGGLPKGRVIAVDDASEVKAVINERLRQGNVVLFKASRACRLERAVEAAHRRLAEISGALKRAAA